jgi:rhodanese-related sulfurtransferase
MMLYKRYFPILGIPYIQNWKNRETNHLVIIDVRDYNVSYKNPVQGVINIPIAYLNRYFNEIPNRDILVIASTSLEKNVGIRLLRRKGFHVIGYTLTGNFRINENQKELKSIC